MNVDVQKGRSGRTTQPPDPPTHGTVELLMGPDLEAAAAELARLFSMLGMLGWGCSLRWLGPGLDSQFRARVMVVLSHSPSSRMPARTSATAPTLKNWLKTSKHCELTVRLRWS